VGAASEGAHRRTVGADGAGQRAGTWARRVGFVSLLGSKKQASHL
jgi:hypothetical protein